jgi:hypothetical protein
VSGSKTSRSTSPHPQHYIINICVLIYRLLDQLYRMVHYLLSAWSSTTSTTSPPNTNTKPPAAMEVFLTGLPPDLTDRSLQSQLTPYLETVNIRDWSCQKPRKKPFGNITFLRADDGQRFLQRYERPSFPGAKRYATGLVIFGSRVTCKLSNRLPDTFLLRSLTKSAAEREEADQ